MKPYLSLLAALLLPVLCLAQSNYKPASIVTTKGDTLTGYIDFREWSGTPTELKFKKDLKSDVQLITPENVQSLDINKWESYMSYTGPVTMNKISENNVINERDTSFRTGTFFLKVVLKGPNVNIYSFADRVKTRWFYTDKDNPVPQELIYRLYYNPNQVTMMQGRTVHENTYMKQLYNLAYKYNALDANLQRTIEDARYDEYYIKGIVKLINKAKK